MGSQRAARPRAPPFVDPPEYAQLRPEETLLYRLVEQHYPELVVAREAAGRPLLKYVQKECEAYLKCGRLEHGFLRVRCESGREARRVPLQGARLLRLMLPPQGKVRYRLKTPYRDGTTHIVLEPPDFLALLAVLVRLPRVYVTRYHGVFARMRHCGRRSRRRGRGVGRAATAEGATPKHVARRWAQRLKHVFAIEIERCQRCNERLTVIASVEDPVLIERILAHVEKRADADAGRAIEESPSLRRVRDSCAGAG